MSPTMIPPPTKKRRQKRGYRSYRVSYGKFGTEHRAFARKLSECGFFIDSNRAVYPAGTPLVVNIEIGGVVYCAQGIIRNAKTSSAALIRLIKPGMGVEFTQLSPELKSAIVAGA